MQSIMLNDQHMTAVDRTRRIVVNFDVSFPINILFDRYRDIDRFVDSLFSFVDADGSQIDSIWWNWCEGNQVPYRSEFLPLFGHPLYRQWVTDGIDIVDIVLQATHQRGKEAFFSHRMNGSDNDLGPFATIPMKVEHPDWLFRTPWCTHEHNAYWNFAVPEVHEYVLRNLREVAERWPFDGLEIDFARGVVFPPGEGWINRDMLTEFVRRLRAYLQAIAVARGHPFLLAARVPDTLVGCHFDGLDVETWVREHLVDMFSIGARSLAGDIAAFRRLTEGTHVKLYPVIDDHHASDGYKNPGIEVFRGAAANWFEEGTDGVQSFNFEYAPDEPYAGEDWPSHLMFYRECGCRETLARKDKTFILQRRGGGHGPTVIPNPENWSTPRYWYNNSNMLAQLPAILDNEGRADTLLFLDVADDLDAHAEHLDALELCLLLSDPAAEALPAVERLERAVIRPAKSPGGVLWNEPPVRGIEERIEVRVNNILLDQPTEEGGWLVVTSIPRPRISRPPCAWHRIYRSVSWLRPSPLDTMSPSTFVRRRKWLLILKLALRRQMVMLLSSPKLWAILPGPGACLRWRVMLACLEQVFTGHSLGNEVQVSTQSSEL